MAIDLLDQVVQVQEISMISRKEHTIVLGCVREVNCVILSGQADIGRRFNVVRCLAKQSNQQRGSRIVVEIDPHDRLIRAMS